MSFVLIIFLITPQNTVALSEPFNTMEACQRAAAELKAVYQPTKLAHISATCHDRR